MKKSGAWLARHALEQIGIRYTFGIPGVHNTEIYDELDRSDLVEPLLVTHECGAAFMADAVSRTSRQTGTLLIVPAAGVTHAASGIGEAFLDGIPMLVICGGIRTDTGKAYQLHDIDLHGLLAPITKRTYKIEAHDQIAPTLFEAHQLANAGEPGPVFVEIPVNIQLFPGEAPDPGKPDTAAEERNEPDHDAILRAAQMLYAAQRPGLFVGWGAVDASAESMRIAQHLNAPVATTLQGLSAFPARHPLHAGMGFGRAAVPAAANAFARCDCMLAVGTRFSEIATGSYGAVPPEKLVHVDINPNVFSANYPAAIAIEGDARAVLGELMQELEELGPPRQDDGKLKAAIG
ncbi:MAG: thiamine pyrophosphate-binding protein, partial [Lysobacterales bacterium]